MRLYRVCLLMCLFIGILRMAVLGRPTPVACCPVGLLKGFGGHSKGKALKLSCWLGLVPPRVEAFCWLVVSGKVSMVDNLRRKGFALEESSELSSLWVVEGGT